MVRLSLSLSLFQLGKADEWIQNSLANAACTNLYYTAGKYCNLKAGAETHNPDDSSPYDFYQAKCFEC